MRYSLLLLMILVLGGCRLITENDSEGILPGSCLLDQPAISLRITDITTVPDGEPQDSVTVMVQDEDYVESETVDPRWFRLFEMAPDRPGTYDVTILLAGQEVWRRNGVVVEGDSCSVQTVELEVALD